MIAVVQRVSTATVKVNGQTVGQIGHGLLVFLGISNQDSQEDAQKLAQKICQLRIFSDHQAKMNLDISQIQGDILLISQFTLHAKTKKGNRPSFIEAAKPDIAIPLYHYFAAQISEILQKEVQQGIFGADMQVDLCNDGPVTIIIDTKNWQ